jgi:hypothetical protein
VGLEAARGSIAGAQAGGGACGWDAWAGHVGEMRGALLARLVGWTGRYR